MLLRLCQLKSLVLLLVLLSSCSWNPIKKEKAPTPSVFLLNTFNNKWFSQNPEHALINLKERPAPHIFFDTDQELSIKTQEINVVITTPENSPHAYSVDVNSGQRYFSHSYCPQRDIWAVYMEAMERPVFSIGFIPRALDQLGEPQKVIVWSKFKNRYLNIVQNNYHRVKLIGAYMEKSCPEGNCLGKNNWVSRLVFVAVDNEDPLLNGIPDVTNFAQAIDWETSKAYLQNIDGRSYIGDKLFPRIQIGPLIEFDEAFDYFKKRSVILTVNELQKIQKSCHNLYENLWTTAGKDKMESDVFMKKLGDFTKKYFSEISTCEKFVYHGNINQDPKKFWFLSMMSIYYRLHREGYFFDCSHKTWKRNIVDVDGKSAHNLPRDFNKCNIEQFNKAMNYLPNFLRGLKGEKEYFKFIEYDTHSFGTHQKVYSWVKVPTRKMDCINDPNIKIKENVRIFPEDASWEPK